LKGVGHNDWAMFADRSFFKEIMDFVRSHHTIGLRLQ